MLVHQARLADDRVTAAFCYSDWVLGEPVMFIPGSYVTEPECLWVLATQYNDKTPKGLISFTMYGYKYVGIALKVAGYRTTAEQIRSQVTIDFVKICTKSIFVFNIYNKDAVNFKQR